MELELAFPSGKKPKRAHCTNDQMTMDAFGKVVELFVKTGCTRFQKLLKFMKMIPKEEEEVAMGMDNHNDLDYRKRGKTFLRRNFFPRKAHWNWK